MTTTATFTIKDIVQKSGRSMASVRLKIRELHIKPIDANTWPYTYSEEDVNKLCAEGAGYTRPTIDHSVPEGWGKTSADICKMLGISDTEFNRRKHWSKVQGKYVMHGRKPLFVYSDEEVEILRHARECHPNQKPGRKLGSGKSKPRPGRSKVLNARANRDAAEIKQRYAVSRAANMWKLSVHYTHGFVVKAVCLDVATACAIKRSLEICGIDVKISPHINQQRKMPFCGYEGEWR